MDDTYLLAPDLGVIMFDGEIIVYEMLPERGDQGSDARKVPQAKVLGTSTLIEMSAELSAAIEQDRRKNSRPR